MIKIFPQAKKHVEILQNDFLKVKAMKPIYEGAIAPVYPELYKSGPTWNPLQLLCLMIHKSFTKPKV